MEDSQNKLASVADGEAGDYKKHLTIITDCSAGKSNWFQYEDYVRALIVDSREREVPLNEVLSERLEEIRINTENVWKKFIGSNFENQYKSPPHQNGEANSSEISPYSLVPLGKDIKRKAVLKRETIQSTMNLMRTILRAEGRDIEATFGVPAWFVLRACEEKNLGVLEEIFLADSFSTYFI